MKVWRPEYLDDMQPTLNEAQKAGAAFVDEMQALGGGAVGLLAQGATALAPSVAKPSLESVRDWGLDVYNRNMEESQAGRQAPKVARLEDIKLGEEGGLGRAGDWATYQGLKALGTLATIAVGGGVGGAVAKAGTKAGVKQLAKLEAKNFASREAQRNAAQTAARIAGPGFTEAQGARIAAEAGKQVAKNVTRGREIGALGSAFGMEGGGAYGGMVQEGVSPEDAVGPATAVGAVNAALELTPFYAAAKRLGIQREAREGLIATIRKEPGLAAQARKLAGEVVKRGGPGALLGAGAEGITEGLQEIVQIAGLKWAKDQPIFEGWGPEQWSQVANAAAVGTLVGGGVGAVGGQLGGQPQTPAPTPQEHVQALRDELTPARAEPQAGPRTEPRAEPITPEQYQRVNDELLRGRDVAEVSARTGVAEQDVIDIAAGARVREQPDVTSEAAPPVVPDVEPEVSVVEGAPAVDQISENLWRPRVALPQALHNFVPVFADEASAARSVAEVQRIAQALKDGVVSEPMAQDALARLGEKTQAAAPVVEQVESVVQPEGNAFADTTKVPTPGWHQIDTGEWMLNPSIFVEDGAPSWKGEAMVLHTPENGTYSVYKSDTNGYYSDVGEFATLKEARAKAQESGPTVVPPQGVPEGLWNTLVEEYGNPAEAHQDLIETITEAQALKPGENIQYSEQNGTLAKAAASVAGLGAKKNPRGWVIKSPPILTVSQSLKPSSMEEEDWDALLGNWGVSEADTADAFEELVDELNTNGSVNFSEMEETTAHVLAKYTGSSITPAANGFVVGETAPTSIVSHKPETVSQDIWAAAIAESGIAPDTLALFLDEEVSPKGTLYSPAVGAAVAAHQGKDVWKTGTGVLVGDMGAVTDEVAGGGWVVNPEAVNLPSSLENYAPKFKTQQDAANAIYKMSDLWGDHQSGAFSFADMIEEMKKLPGVATAGPSTAAEFAAQLGITQAEFEGLFVDAPPIITSLADVAEALSENVEEVTASGGTPVYSENWAKAVAKLSGGVKVEAMDGWEVHDPGTIPQPPYPEISLSAFAGLISTAPQANATSWKIAIDGVVNTKEANPSGSMQMSKQLAQVVAEKAGWTVVPNGNAWDVEVTTPSAPAGQVNWGGMDDASAAVFNNALELPDFHEWANPIQHAALKLIQQEGSIDGALAKSSNTLAKSELSKWKNDPTTLEPLKLAAENALDLAEAAEDAAQQQTYQPPSQVVVPSLAADGWSPKELPATYIISSFVGGTGTISLPSGLALYFNGTKEELIAVANIHHALKNMDMPAEQKIEELKKLPEDSNQLAHYRSTHPYLFVKVSQDMATTKEMADEFLLTAVTDGVKYSLDDVFVEMDKYAEKYGEGELDAALSAMPSKIVTPPSLAGWLDNVQEEGALLAQNPHKGIWANTKIANGAEARYGIIVINPKTGKVLIRRVANDYEGVTWDFSRGGADRFASIADGKAKLGEGAQFIETGSFNPAKKYMHHPLQAAKKEAREELGIDVRVVGQLATPFYQGAGRTASLYYIGVQEGDFNPSWIEPETKQDEPGTLKGTKWVTKEEAIKKFNQLSQLPPDPSMKRMNLGGKTDPNVAMRTRILRQLEAVFDKDKQRSAWDYKGSEKGIELYYKGDLAQDYPDDLGTLSGAGGLKNFKDLTSLQRLKVAAMTQVSMMHPTATKMERSALLKEEFARRKKALQKWIDTHAPGQKITDIKRMGKEGHGLESGKPLVLEVYHGSRKTREGLYGDKLDPTMFGSGVGGGEDVKEAFFSSFTRSGVTKWALGGGDRSIVPLTMAFRNPLVIDWEGKNWNPGLFAQIVQDAKTGTANQWNQGSDLVRDGVIFERVKDGSVTSQILTWKDDQMIGSLLESVGFTGKNFYQSRVLGKPETPMEVKDARVVLEREFGKEVIGKLVKDGKLRLEEFEEEPLVQGLYDGEKDQVSLFMENIGGERELLGAFLHEGRHARLDQVLGEALPAYYKDFEGLYGRGIKTARMAVEETALQGARRFGIAMDYGLTGEARRVEIQRVRGVLKEIDPTFVGQEDLANFIQASVQTGQKTSLMTRLVNAIRVWFAQTSLGKKLKAAGWGGALTEEMAVGLARASVKRFAQGERKGNGKYYAFVGHTTAVDWEPAPGFPYGKPDLSHIGTGEGYLSFGWGWYALESKGSLKYYQSTIGQQHKVGNAGMKLLGFHVPDRHVLRLLEWDRSMNSQQPVVQAAIRSPKDGFLLLKVARKARERSTKYPSGPKVAAAYNTGDYSLYYSESLTAGPSGKFVLIKPNKSNYSYPHDKQYVEGAKAFLDLAATKGTLAPVLEELRKSGKPDGQMREELRELLDVNKKGTGSSLYNELRQYFWDKDYNGHWTAKNKARKKASLYLRGHGVVGVHYLDAGSRETGHGTYNWVFWDQDVLDSLTMTWKNKQQLVENPSSLSYDPNAQGEKFPQVVPEDELVLDKSGKWLYARTGGVREYSQGQIEDVIERAFSKGWLRRAKELDLLQVYRGRGPGGISGAFDMQTGKVSLFAQSMPADENPLGVVLHEGAHQTLRVMLGDKVVGRLARDTRSLAESGNELAQMAVARAEWEALGAIAQQVEVGHSLHDVMTPAEQQAERRRVEAEVGKKLAKLSEEEKAKALAYKNFVRDEEVLSYYAQFAAEKKGGLFRRIVNRVKTAWVQSVIGGTMTAAGLGPRLTDEMMVALARRATTFGVDLRSTARRLAEGAGIEAGADFVSQGAVLASRPGWVDWSSMYTDPLDQSIDTASRPGAFNRIQQNWVEMFTDLWKLAPRIARGFNLMRSKKAAAQRNVQELILDPFVKLGKESGLTEAELDDGFAAAHVLLDGVNRENAGVKAELFSKELEKALPGTLGKELTKERKKIRASVLGENATLSAPAGREELAQELDRIFNMKYMGESIKTLPEVKEIYRRWETVKDHSGGFSTGEGDVDVVDQTVPRAATAYNKVKDNVQFQEMQRYWKTLVRTTLDILVSGDLMTQDAADVMSQKYRNYAPLRREGYALPPELQSIFSYSGKTMAERYGAEGYAKPVNVMQNGFAQHDMAIAAADRNMVLIDFAKEIRGNPEKWKGWFRVQERDAKDQGKDKMGFETSKPGGVDPTDIPFVEILQTKEGREYAQQYVIHPAEGNVRAAKIASAIQGLEVTELNGPMKLMRGINNWIRWVNISASPAFMIVNAPRDAGTALMNLQSTRIADKWTEVMGEYGKSLRQLKRYYIDKDRNYSDPEMKMVIDWEEAGGRASFVQSLRPEDEGFGSVGKKIARRQGRWQIPGTNVEFKSAALGTVWDKGAKALEAIETANILLENVMRFSTFKVAVRNGYSLEEAALLSKDITTNFDRRGFHTQVLSTWWLFFNATVQGNVQVVRNLMKGENRQRMLAAAGGMMTLSLLMDLAAAAMSDDEDGDGRGDWDSIPDWQKERQVFFPMGFGDDETYASVPAPWVFNVLWRGGQMMGEMLRGVREPGSIAPELAGLVATTMNPVGGATLLQAISPTALDPLVQMAENVDAFGNKIRPDSFPGDVRPKSQLSWSSTPEGYKWVAEEVNKLTGGNVAESGAWDFAPGDVKILSDFVMGSAGRMFAGLVGKTWEAAQGEMPEVTDLPGVKNFLVNPKDPKEAGLFHERVARVHGAARVLEMLPPSERWEHRTERGAELQLLGYAKDAERQVRALRKQMRMAELRGDDARVERLRERVEGVYQGFNGAWERKVGGF